MTKNEKNLEIAKFFDLHIKEAVLPAQYHQDWNCLMEVVELLEDMIENKNDEFLKEILGDNLNFFYISQPQITLNIKESGMFKLVGRGDNRIEKLQDVVYQFVVWYRENCNK